MLKHFAAVTLCSSSLILGWATTGGIGDRASASGKIQNAATPAVAPPGCPVVPPQCFSVFGGDEKRDALRFADAIETGSPFSMEFTYPFTNRTMKRTVVGKGHYVEQMPGGGQMEVHFSGERTKVLVAFLRSAAKANELLQSGTRDYFEVHDGKEVLNPLVEALAKNTGEVTIVRK